MVENNALYYGSDLWGNPIQEELTGKEKVSAIGTAERWQESDNLLVTVIVKQAGFYGGQQRFSVKVNANSHLLRALDKERKGSKEISQLLLDQITKSVQSVIVPLVS